MLERIAGIIREQLNLTMLKLQRKPLLKMTWMQIPWICLNWLWHLKKLTMLRSLLKTLRSWKPSAMLWITSEIKKSTLNLR